MKKSLQMQAVEPNEQAAIIIQSKQRQRLAKEKVAQVRQRNREIELEYVRNLELSKLAPSAAAVSAMEEDPSVTIQGTPEEQSAASFIQKRSKARAAKLQLAKEKKEAIELAEQQEAAAMKIQSKQRQKAARQQVAERRKEVLKGTGDGDGDTQDRNHAPVSQITQIEESKAAIAIQKVACGRIDRQRKGVAGTQSNGGKTKRAAGRSQLNKSDSEETKAAIKIQKVARGKLARHSQGQPKSPTLLRRTGRQEAAAALAIQRVARGRLARQQLAAQRSSPMKTARRRPGGLENEQAAILIQSKQRQRLAQQEVVKRRQESQQQHRAATVIQHRQKVRQKRKAPSPPLVVEDVTDTIKGTPEEQSAATFIQKRAKARAAKLQLAKESREAIELAEQQKAAALKIQSIQRQRAARQQVEERRRAILQEEQDRAAVVAIQQVARRRLAQRQVAEKKVAREVEREEVAAAIAIQKAVRGKVTRRRVSQLKGTSHKPDSDSAGHIPTPHTSSEVKILAAPSLSSSTEKIVKSSPVRHQQPKAAESSSAQSLNGSVVSKPLPPITRQSSAQRLHLKLREDSPLHPSRLAPPLRTRHAPHKPPRAPPPLSPVSTSMSSPHREYGTKNSPVVDGGEHGPLTLAMRLEARKQETELAKDARKMVRRLAKERRQREERRLAEEAVMVRSVVAQLSPGPAQAAAGVSPRMSLDNQQVPASLPPAHDVERQRRMREMMERQERIKQMADAAEVRANAANIIAQQTASGVLKPVRPPRPSPSQAESKWNVVEGYSNGTGGGTFVSSYRNRVLDERRAAKELAIEKQRMLREKNERATAYAEQVRQQAHAQAQKRRRPFEYDPYARAQPSQYKAPQHGGKLPTLDPDTGSQVLLQQQQQQGFSRPHLLPHLLAPGLSTQELESKQRPAMYGERNLHQSISGAGESSHEDASYQDRWQPKTDVGRASDFEARLARIEGLVGYR